MSSSNKLRSSVCCFHAQPHQFLQNEDDHPLPHRPTTPSSCRTWLKSTAHQLPDHIRGRCRYLRDWICHTRAHSSARFSYDPSSYALNFDDEFPARHVAIFPRDCPFEGGRVHS